MATDQQGHPVIRPLFDHVEDAFLEIFANDRAPWIFKSLDYNSLSFAKLGNWSVCYVVIKIGDTVVDCSGVAWTWSALFFYLLKILCLR